MSKDWDDQLNNGMSGGDEFSLESILAEFGGKKAKKKVEDDTIPFPIIPQKKRSSGGTGKPGRVLTFPEGGDGARRPAAQPARQETAPQRQEPARRDGTQSGETAAPKEKPAARRQEAPARKEQPPKKQASKKEAARPAQPEEKVVDFPEEENPLAQGISRLLQKADKYAEHMFEEEDVENDQEVRRAEELIPGTDEEEDDEEEFRPFRRRERKPRKEPPPAPDIPPADLARRYSKGLKGLRVRAVLVFLLFLPSVYLTVDLFPYPDVLTPQLRVLALAGVQVLAMLLGLDVLFRGLFRLFRLDLGMDTLLVFASAAVLADALTLYQLDPREGQMPYCAAIVLGIALLLRGTNRKRRGMRLACKTAASAAHPYLVTLDDAKWNGWGTYTKWLGEPVGFGRQIQASDGAERIFKRVCPLLLIGSVVLSLVASVGQGAPERLLWCFAATLTAATSLSGALCFSGAWLSLCRRLSKSGAAIAGWDGVTATGGSGILLTDADLFPPGSVALNGIKIFGDFPAEKVVACTATLIRESGCGLDKLFHDLLRAQGATYRRVSSFYAYEGGLSGVIRNEQILVGSTDFMRLMDVALPPGLRVKNAVFCAIDRELAGIFALNYSLHGTLDPSLNSLIRNKVTPVMVTRDFNLTPAMLHQRFKLPVDRMEYPGVERRMELSDQDQLHSDILTAVLCREGIGPYSEAVVGAARLRRAVRASAVLASLGSLVGLLLAFYLTYMGAYASLSAANLLVFLIMWLVPTPLISGMVNKY